MVGGVVSKKGFWSAVEEADSSFRVPGISTGMHSLVGAGSDVPVASSALSSTAALSGSVYM